MVKNYTERMIVDDGRSFVLYCIDCTGPIIISSAISLAIGIKLEIEGYLFSVIRESNEKEWVESNPINLRDFEKRHPYYYELMTD